MSDDKLNIRNEMAQFDRKNRNFYDELNDEEKKKFAPFLMIRWGSSVGGSPDLQSYYVMSCNENLNKHFFDISAKDHKKFQWLLSTTVSPGMGNQYHQWIKPKKKEANDNKAVKFIREMRPHLREDEIQLLSQLNSKDELKEYARGLGWEDKDIKKEL
jgi:hypothetical protein